MSDTKHRRRGQRWSNKDQCFHVSFTVVCGHVAKKEYSRSVKTCAVGRHKQNGRSYICPCCIHAYGMGGFAKFKKMSRRHIRRTFTKIIHPDD